MYDLSITDTLIPRWWRDRPEETRQPTYCK